MRALLPLVLILAAASAAAQEPPRIDTLQGQFLFISGDTAYIRCEADAGPDDSIGVNHLGAWLGADTPIWRFGLSLYSNLFQMGDTVTIYRYHLPRRATSARLLCDTLVWDPLAIRSGSAQAAATLIHRGLFRYDATGHVEGDLARTWFYRGSDLFVVLDTASRFGDGTPVSAAAVKSSLERYFWYRRDVPDFSWQYTVAGVEAYRRGLVSHVTGIIPRSVDTLQFNMAQPFYELPGYLAAPQLSIVKWGLESRGAPVRATCGYYGQRHGDTLLGRPPHYGSLELMAADSRSGAAIHPVAESPDTTSVSRRVRLPEAVLLCVRTSAEPSLLSFLEFAIDRQAVAAALDGGSRSGAYFVTEGSAWPFVDDVGPFMRSAPDLARARAARDLIRGRPHVRVAAAPGFEPVAAYLVNALLAWNFRAERVDSTTACDLWVQRWSSEGSLPDAYIESALDLLQGTGIDSLVNHLISARSMADPEARERMYRATLGRVAAAERFMVLCQEHTRVERTSILEVVSDDAGRPRGPIFVRRESP